MTKKDPRRFNKLLEFDELPRLMANDLNGIVLKVRDANLASGRRDAAHYQAVEPVVWFAWSQYPFIHRPVLSRNLRRRLPQQVGKQFRMVPVIERQRASRRRIGLDSLSDE